MSRPGVGKQNYWVFRLLKESQQLEESKETLNKKIMEIEESLKNLEEDKAALEIMTDDEIDDT